MIRLSVNGKSIEVPNGAMVATAVVLAGEDSFRRSANGSSRGPLCGMGICFECRVTIDGVEHRRSCNVPCVDGMNVKTG